MRGASRRRIYSLHLTYALISGGNLPKALIKAAGKTNGGWVMRPADTSEGFNTARWHAVTMELARQCGLKTLAFQYLPGPLNGAYLERFDRSHNGTPLMALSAATLVTPRVNIRTGKPVLPTYLDIADILNRDGADTKTDLRELFARLLLIPSRVTAATSSPTSFLSALRMAGGLLRSQRLLSNRPL